MCRPFSCTSTISSSSHPSSGSEKHPSHSMSSGYEALFFRTTRTAPECSSNFLLAYFFPSPTLTRLGQMHGAHNSSFSTPPTSLLYISRATPAAHSIILRQKRGFHSIGPFFLRPGCWQLSVWTTKRLTARSGPVHRSSFHSRIPPSTFDCLAEFVPASDCELNASDRANKCRDKRNVLPWQR